MKIDGGLKLDQEWIDLMTEAKELGISESEVRAFIMDNRENSIKIRNSRNFKMNKNNSCHYATF
ncbi:hypothetical protein BTR23_11245 [Alkalihalophilus pseudofirmus]|nr:hypothetical protein BTR23_11245 [Alkalihalophilus pseudofirmus]